MPSHHGDWNPEETIRVWRWDLLKRYRMSMGWNQRELGEAVGLTHGAVTHWETGRRLPSLQAFRRLCEELRVPPGVMLGMEADMEPDFEVTYTVRWKPVEGDGIWTRAVARTATSGIFLVEGVASPNQIS